MKSLLLKDFYLLKHTQILINSLVSIGAGFLLTLHSDLSNRLGIMTGMLMIALSTAVSSTIYMDQSSDFYRFAATSPISKSIYVIEKYLLILILSVLAILLGTMISFLTGFINHPHFWLPLLAFFFFNLLYRSIDLSAVLFKIRCYHHHLSSVSAIFLIFLVFIFILFLIFLPSEHTILFEIVLGSLSLSFFIGSCLLNCRLYNQWDL